MLSLYLSMVETDEQRTFIEELYKNYERKMYGVAFGILHNKHDAEDAVHSAFIRIIENIEKIMQIPADEQGYYIVIISRNTSIDILRKRENSEIPLENIEVVEDTVSLDDIIDSRLTSESIRKCIFMLEETDFEVLFLHLLCELSAADIAKLLNIKSSTASQRIYKAKKNLRKIIEEQQY
jgi:RNA polymerase sigma factor, sigma-70 family